MADFQIAKLMWSVWENCRPLVSRKKDPYRIADFVPGMARSAPKAAQTAEEQLEMVKLLNALFGGEDLTGNPET